MRDRPGPTPPVPLVIATAVIMLEGLVLLGYAVLEAARAVMGVTTAVFFALLGALLAGGGALLLRGRAWPRSPVIVAQVMFLGLAWNFRVGETRWVAVGLAVAAITVLIGLLHPASTEALADGDPPAAS